MSSIKVMDELLANKIAAGEVVERCASVIKELVENAIDAEATSIIVEVKEAGMKQMKVIDNGIGMDKEDATLAFSRHATSKLKTEYDLFHIETLGFRGEALASIASVCKVILQTSNGKEGTKVEIEGGKIKSVTNLTINKGTSIEVKDLFYNTPARLKHMKSFYTELASISEYMNKIALSHPEIRFIFTSDGNELLNTDGSSSLLKVIKSTFGMETARNMEQIEGEKEDYKVSGYISKPEIHKSKNNGIITIVNGRVVRNIELNHTINEAYHSYKPDNRYPVVVLNIQVDTSLVDVNIHPTKMDIKFSKIEVLKELIDSLIKEKLKGLNHTVNVEAKEIKKYEEVKLTFDEVPVKKVEEKIEYKINDYYEKDIIKVEEKEKEANPTFKKLYPVGIALGTYIICHNEEGITLIDQHAAKERCNYEYFKKKMGEVTKDSIAPIIPYTFEFPNNEFIILKNHFDILVNLGFEIEEFGISSIIVKKHPIWLTNGEEKEAIYKILESIISFENKFDIEKFNEKAATMLSCKKAIKANQNISNAEMEKLIHDLSTCNNPYHCPHGRPTMIHLSIEEIEKLFKRSGF